MLKSTLTRRQLCIAGCVVIMVAGLIEAARHLRRTPESTFHLLAAARNVQGIEFVAFRSDIGKDSSYTWRFRHSAEVVPRVLASLPFHRCDAADNDWLRQMFADDFKIPQRSLTNYTGYRGDNAIHDAEYLLVAPDGRESFYYYINF